MTFWILISLTALAIAAILALALLRGRNRGEPAAAYDLRVYREQLTGVDRDLARGVIGKQDAERIRTEISRRILAADAQMQRESAGQSQPPRLSRAVAAIAALVLIGGGVALYSQLGAPGYGDLPLDLRQELAEEMRAERPDQDRAEAGKAEQPEPDIDENYANLIEQLRDAVKQRPEDVKGLTLLARHEANLGNFRAAYEAKAQANAVQGDQVSADDLAEQAELMVVAASGYVSPETEAVLRRALDIDPANGPARYYWGLMMTQTGRPDIAFRIWEETLRESPADAPWVEPIRSQIGDLALRAGVNYTLPAAPAATGQNEPGPDAGDVAAAAEMDAEARSEMIRGMVTRLSDRLATEGGTPEEWARLIGALGVLGETDRARAIHDEARTVFAGQDEALALIGAAAVQAGIAQ